MERKIQSSWAKALEEYKKTGKLSIGDKELKEIAPKNTPKEKPTKKSRMNVSKAICIIRHFDYQMQSTTSITMKDKYENEYDDAVEFLEELERGRNE